MSGTIVNNVARASGTIAATPGGLDWSAAVVTASTVTVEAGRGYFINTTSNACTITLPAEAEIGDQIVIADYARTWATNAVTLDSNGLKFQGEDDTYTVDYDTVGQSLNIVFSDSTKGWLPVSDDAVADVPVAPATQRGLFAFGSTGGAAGGVNMSNKVNSSGVVATDTSGVGTARRQISAANYGGDKAIFAFGNTGGSNQSNLSNLVNNSGTVQSDATGVGTANRQRGGVGYGGDKAVFAFGYTSGFSNQNNLVNNTGVVQSDGTGVGTARYGPTSSTYGSTGQALFAFGSNDSGMVNMRNLVSNQGVIASDASGAGTARFGLGGAAYGGDKGIMAFGYEGDDVHSAVSNKISNTGVVASDTGAVGTAREYIDATAYGADKALFAFGSSGGTDVNTRNLVSNQGVVSADASGAGTARDNIAAAGYSYSA